MATVEQIQIIADELTNDPNGWGYEVVGSENPGPGPLTDQEVADLLNDATKITRIKALMTSSEIFQSVDITELNALTEPKRNDVLSMLSFGELKPNGKEADLFVDIFGGGSATVIALQAARQETISRAKELGLSNLTLGNIEAARALP
jgi:hypothetical protein